MTKKYYLVCACFVMTIVSCFEKQENAISPPETPVYSISGYLVSSLTGEPVSQANVVFSGQVKYVGQDSSMHFSARSITDDHGFFLFQNVPGGFAYTLQCQKSGYQQLVKKIVMAYQDRDLDSIVFDKALSVAHTYHFDQYDISGISLRNGRVWLSDSSTSRLVELNEHFSVAQDSMALPFKPMAIDWNDDDLLVSTYDSSFVYRLSAAGLTLVSGHDNPNNMYHPENKIAVSDFFWLDNQVAACSRDIPTKYVIYDLIYPENAVYVDNPEGDLHAVGISARAEGRYIACFPPDGITKLYIVDSNTNQSTGYYALSVQGGPLIVQYPILWLAGKKSVFEFVLDK